jgi:hypothetical protein
MQGLSESDNNVEAWYRYGGSLMSEVSLFYVGNELLMTTKCFAEARDRTKIGYFVVLSVSILVIILI